MGITRKVLRKVAAKIETTPGTYDTPSTLLPFTEFTVMQTFDMIEDESNTGDAFPDLPLQGVRKIEGTLSGEIDLNTFPIILEWANGAISGTTFEPASNGINVKSLSIVHLDGVKTNKYSGVYAKSLTITGEAEGKLMYSADVVGWKAEVRDDTSFPTITINPGQRIPFHAGGSESGSGFFRLADFDALMSGSDDITISKFELKLNWNFDNQFSNSDQGTLIPLSGASGRPTVEFSFSLSRHNSDTLFADRDNDQAKWLAASFWLGSTKFLNFEVTSFKLQNITRTDEDVPGVDIEAAVGRNINSVLGLNSEASTGQPIYFDLTNT